MVQSAVSVLAAALSFLLPSHLYLSLFPFQSLSPLAFAQKANGKALHHAWYPKTLRVSVLVIRIKGSQHHRQLKAIFVSLFAWLSQDKRRPIFEEEI